jgi:hypothetical protein
MGDLSGVGIKLVLLVIDEVLLSEVFAGEFSIARFGGGEFEETFMRSLQRAT